MNCSSPLKTLFLSSLLFVASAAQANMRCGNKLVQLGDDFSQVEDICGLPYARYALGDKYISAKEGYTKRAGGGYSNANLEYTETVTVDMWVYKPGVKKINRLLYFENGILVKIKKGGRN